MDFLAECDEGRRWIRHLDSERVLAVSPPALITDWLEEHYLELLRDAVRKVAGQGLRIEIQTSELTGSTHARDEASASPTSFAEGQGDRSLDPFRRGGGEE